MLMFLRIFDVFVNIYGFLIVVWCIISWFPRRQGTLFDDIAQAINSLVAPYINLFRRIIPPLGGIDLSPMIAILALWLIQYLVELFVINLI